MYEKLIDELNKNPANNYVVKEAEILADKVLEIGGYAGKNAAMPIIKIASQFGFKTYQANNMPNDISGNIFVGGNTYNDYGNDKIIIVDAKEPLPHQRFIVAHELAHYLLDYVGNKSYTPEIIFSKTYPKINHESLNEIRAYRFAAELLMPKNVFMSEYIKAMQKSDGNYEYVIPYLSELFTVKEACIRKRIKEVFER